jgi:hypothetical protein
MPVFDLGQKKIIVTGYCDMLNNLKQEFVSELPTSPASGKIYMKHKIVFFKRLRHGSKDFQSKIMISVFFQFWGKGVSAHWVGKSSA